MRILHVVTLVGPGNPYGGPLSVALGHADELRRRDHSVTVMAGLSSGGRRSEWDAQSLGVQSFPTFQPLPRLGFSGLIAPTAPWHLWRSMGAADVVHVHLSRELITLPAALIAMGRRVPYVVQTHGMIDASDRRLADVLDRVATKRVMRNASAVLCLHDAEVGRVRDVGGDELTTTIVPNGVEVALAPRELPTIARFLFASRLATRKRPQLFALAASHLRKRGLDAEFVIRGSDEGERESVRRILDAAPDPGIELGEALEPGDVRSEIARSSAIVLPSVDEPFPMIVLEALAESRPVFITESCGLADLVRTYGCGTVIPDDDQPALETALREFALDPVRQQRESEAASRAAKAAFTISAVADRLEIVYRTAVEESEATR